MVAVISFFLTLVALRLAIGPACRWDWVDRPTTRKHHAAPIPWVGGLVLWAVFTIGFACLVKPEAELPVLAAMSAVTLLGFVDDRHGVRSVVRLLWQSVTVLLLLNLDPSLKLVQLGNLFGTGNLDVGGWTWWLTPFAVCGMINAFNMIDGLDGLAAGLGLMTVALLWVLVSHAGMDGANLSGLLEWIALALIGFLSYNARYPGHPRATVFLGDAGSTLLGFVLTWFMLRFSQSGSGVMDAATALWLVAVPLMDTVAVMVRRWRMGLSPFTADRQHIPESVVLILYI